MVRESGGDPGAGSGVVEVAVTAPPGSPTWVVGARKAPSRWRHSLVGHQLASPPILLILL